jgi:hypothetical protein
MWSWPTSRCYAGIFLERVTKTTKIEVGFFWAMHPNDWGSNKLWNVGKLLPDYTALQLRREPSSNSPPWEPQILLWRSSVSLGCFPADIRTACPTNTDYWRVDVKVQQVVSGYKTGFQYTNINSRNTKPWMRSHMNKIHITWGFELNPYFVFKQSWVMTFCW